MNNKLLVPILLLTGVLILFASATIFNYKHNYKVVNEFKPNVIHSTEAVQAVLTYGTYEVRNKEEISNLLSLGYIEIVPDN